MDFRKDPQYLESVLKSVRVTKRKRRSLVIRAAARQVVNAAQESCQLAGVAVCTVAGPCGMGACPFADGVFRAVRLAAKPGENARPTGVVSPHPTFSQDQLVTTLRKMLPHT